MGLENTRKQYKYVTLQVMDKEKNIDPCFILTEKNDHDRYVESGRYNQISGWLTKVEHRVFTFEGRAIDKLVFSIFDVKDGTTYQVQAGFSSVARSICNQILSITDFSNIAIVVYRKKGEDSGKDYPGVLIWHGKGRKEKASWVMTPEEVRAFYRVVTIRNQEEVDTYDADMMLANKAIAHVEQFAGEPEIVIPDEPEIVIPDEPESLKHPVDRGERMIDQVRREKEERKQNSGDQFDPGFPSGEDDLPF